MARLIGRGSRQAVYYLTTSVGSYADHQVFRFLADGRDVQDVPSLMDVLGRGVDERHDAYFVLGPDMAAAASVIRRCYPGTELSSETTPGGTPVLALGISAAALRAGHGCVVPSDGPGLRARYFEGPEWTGPVVRERLEDWPFPQRWKGDERDGFGSVEWSGFVRLPVSGSYRFQWLVSGGGVVGTRGEAVIGSRIHLEKQGDARARLTAGVYPVRLRCRPQSARAYCWLRWEPPGGFLQAVPPEFWLPPCRGEGNDACSP